MSGDNTIDTISIDVVSSGDNAIKDVDTLIAKLDKLQSILDSSKAGKLVKVLNQVGNSVNNLHKKLSNLNLINFKGLFNNLKSVINNTDKAANGVANTAGNTKNAKRKKSEPKEEIESDDIKPAKNIFVALGRAGMQAAMLIGSGFKTAFQGAIGGTKKFGNLAVKTFGNGVKSAGKFATRLLNIGKNTAKVTGNFAKFTSKIKIMSLALLGARSAFTAIRKAASEYMNYDTELSDTLQNNWAVLGSILAPVLEKVISLFSTAVAYIANFIKILTGIDVVARANSKALDRQSASAKNALGNLAKFDDLNTVDFGDSNKNSLPTLTIDQIDTSPLDIFIAKIKEQDWYGLGMEISREFNEALASINFDQFIEKASQFGTNFSDLLNGIFDGMDWKQLGTKVGQGLEGITEALYNFIYNTNWDVFGSGIGTSLVNSLNKVDFSKVGAILVGKFNIVIKTLAGFVTTPGIWTTLGSKLADGFNGAWNSIDWNSLATTINQGIMGLFDSIITFLQGVDWEQVGLDIWNFIASIDWSGIISKFAETLGALIAGIGQLLWGFIETAVIDFGNYFSEKIEECGGDIIHGLLKGIDDALVGIGTWIKDNIFTPFINGFKEIFRIHSPSTVMIEMGTYIIEGFKNGISNIWESVKYIFTDLNIKIGNTFTEIVEKIKDIFNIDNIKGHFSNVVDGIKDVFSNIPNWFKETFSKAWENVKNVFSTGGKIFSGIKEGISATFATVVNKIIDGMNKIISIPFKNINRMLNKIRSIEFLGISPFKNLWSENPLPTPQIPKLATGTNKIEYEGLYHLHKDEAVVPKKYNPAVNNKAYEQGNSNVVNAIYTLIDVVQNMETTNIVNVDAEQVYKKTSKYANRKTNKYGVVVDDI